MSGGKIKRPNVFAVQVYGDVVIESEDRQRLVRSRLGLHMHRTAVAQAAAAFQALANVILRDDRCLFLEVCVSSGVVAVVMRVNDAADGFASETIQGALNFTGKRSLSS